MRIQFWWAILLVVLLSVPALFLVAEKSKPQLPTYGSVADFTLTERSGRVVSLQELKGKLWVADFFFTNCPAQCPLMSQKMSELQKKLPPTATLVSFSVDPDRDTPQTLAEYAKNYNAQEARWLFLTGDKETLNRLAQSFHLPTIEDPSQHSLRLVLVDRNARIRGYYDARDENAITRLLGEAKALRRYEADTIPPSAVP